MFYLGEFAALQPERVSCCSFLRLANQRNQPSAYLRKQGIQARLSQFWFVFIKKRIVEWSAIRQTLRPLPHQSQQLRKWASEGAKIIANPGVFPSVQRLRFLISKLAYEALRKSYGALPFAAQQIKLAQKILVDPTPRGQFLDQVSKPIRYQQTMTDALQSCQLFAAFVPAGWR